MLGYIIIKDFLGGYLDMETINGIQIHQDDNGNEYTFCSCGCGEKIPLTYNYKWKLKRGLWKSFKTGHGRRTNGKKIIDTPLLERKKLYQNGDYIKHVLVNEQWITKKELAKQLGCSEITLYKYMHELNYTYRLFAGLRADKLREEGKDCIIFYPGSETIDEPFTKIVHLHINYSFPSKARWCAVSGLGAGRLSIPRTSMKPKFKMELTPTDVPHIYEITSEKVLKLVLDKDLLRTVGEKKIRKDLAKSYGEDLEIKWIE